MATKAFVLKRICIYAGEDIDPDCDEQVTTVLRNKFNVQLPQRPTMQDSLSSAIVDLEIIDLILEYRGLS